MNSFWRGRKVLVTGAGGFTGSNLCNALAEHQAKVTAFLRTDGSKRKLHPNVNIELIQYLTLPLYLEM